MAITLVNGKKLSTWLGQYSIVARIINGKAYATQQTNDGGYIVRGLGIVTNPDSIKDASTTQAEIDQLEVSDAYGVQTPLSFQSEVGYSLGHLTDGTPVYYPDALVKQKSGQMNGGVVETYVNVPPILGNTSNAFTDIWTWIQANPMYSGLILAVLYLMYDNATTKKGKKSILSKIF